MALVTRSLLLRPGLAEPLALTAGAAALIAREWNNDPPASAITSLPRWTFLAQATHHGHPTRPFLFHNLAITDLYADAHHPEQIAAIQPVIDQASGRKDAAETITALDTLDQRIHDHLASHGDPSPTPGHGEAGRSTMPRLPDPEDTQP